MIEMIMHMMTMTIGLVFPIKIGRIVVKGVTSTVDIVMILIMIEVVEEMVIGGGVDRVIEKEIKVRIEGMIGKEMKAHIEGMNPHGLTVTLDQGPLEGEAMAGAIERTAMTMLEVKGLRGDETVKRSVSVSLILLYDLLLCVLVNCLILLITCYGF